MPREELTDHEVLAHLARQRNPASLREIADELRLRRAARQALKKILARLARKGEVTEVTPGRYALPGAAHGKLQPKPTAEKPARPAPAAAQPSGPGTDAELRDPNVIRGRLVVHRDGYGFVVPEKRVAGLEGDLFIGPENVGDAMHGDAVAARIVRRRHDGRAEGRIVRVVRRAHPTVVGQFHYGPSGNHVTPYDARLTQPIVVPPGDELPPGWREKAAAHGSGHGRRRAALPELDGAVVDVELTRFPQGGVPPAGRVVEILGRPGEMGIDIEIIIRKHHIPHEFPEEVMEEARATSLEVRVSDLAGREDFRRLPIVTIDGETARDFDDAVYVERLANGHYLLQVHIADVAHYVGRGSALDREARLRGTSVYFPDRAVAMLPEALSNGICSLHPRVDRLVMSALLEIDSHGAVLGARFTPGVIHSAERMTYTNVNKVLEGDPEASRRYAALAERFRLMRELALILNARRNGRGSIDFDLPEPVIEFDEYGRMAGIVRSERNIAHRIIEEFMLAANEAVARHLEERGLASLHRVHEKPDPKKVLEFEELAHAFGYTLGVADLAERQIVVKHGRLPAARQRRGDRGRERVMSVTLPAADFDIRPQHYQRLAQKIAGKPEERILSYLMLRSLKQARYAAEALGHFALAADCYTHFTSPIRRYPDLVVHRVLKWALQHKGTEDPPGRKPSSSPARIGTATAGPARGPVLGGPYRVWELEEIAAESSDAERRADSAERELMDWKTAQFMEQHLGEEYEALIISVVKFGVFVELMEVFVEGLVPISALEEFTGQRCQFRERDRCIVTEAAQHGRGSRAARGHAFRLGDRVRVRAERVDPVLKRVEFAVVSLKAWEPPMHADRRR
jgi:ribonuclease R